MLLLLLACNSSFYNRLVVEGSEVGQSLGKQPASAGDVDGDGVPDLAVRDVAGTLVFSGLDMLGSDAPTVDSALARLPLPAGLDFPDTTQQIGELLSLGDLNGDGASELADAIGCRRAETCGDVAWVRVYDGESVASGSPRVLWEVELTEPELLSLDVGALDTDGLPIMAIMTRSEVWVMRGEDLRDGVPFTGTAIAGPHADVTLADLNGDGGDELVLGQPEASGGGRVRVYTWTGTERRPAPLQTIVGPEDANFGLRMASLDLDHGGQEDLMISGSTEGDPGDSPEMLWHVSGESLSLDGTRFELAQEDEGSFNPLNSSDLRGNIGVFGHSLDACTDLDGDGLSDLVFAARPARGRLTTRDGRILALSDEDSSGSFLLWQHPPRDGWLLYVACLGDLDGDGLGEVLVGTPGTRRVAQKGAGEFWVLRTDIP